LSFHNGMAFVHLISSFCRHFSPKRIFHLLTNYKHCSLCSLILYSCIDFVKKKIFEFSGIFQWKFCLRSWKTFSIQEAHVLDSVVNILMRFLLVRPRVFTISM
jgi:hypothetical protein